MPTEKEIVANRLKVLLAKAGITQKKLSDISGVSKDTISKAVNKGELSVKCAKLIAAALNVSLDYLYGHSQLQNAQEYALEIMVKHIDIRATKSYYDQNQLISSVAFSKPFAEYLDAMHSAEKSTGIPTTIKSQWQDEVRKKFLEAIDIESTEKKAYALIDLNLLSPNILSLLKENVEEASRQLK